MEALIGNRFIISRAAEVIRKKYARYDSINLTIEQVISVCVSEKDPELYKIFEDVSQKVAITLINLVTSFDTETIIINNKWMPSFPELFNRTSDTVYRLCPWKNRNTLQISLCRDEKLFTRASCALALNAVFKDSAHNIFLSHND